MKPSPEEYYRLRDRVNPVKRRTETSISIIKRDRKSRHDELDHLKELEKIEQDFINYD